MPIFDHLFGPFARIAFLGQAALTIWMLVDNGRRRGESYWFWIILIFQPLGAWAYFFAVKFPTLGGRYRYQAGSRLASLFQPRASLEELRYKAEHIPTLASRLALAERLIEKSRFEEAVPHLETSLKSEPDHGQILYSLALCYARLGRPGESGTLLDRLLARDPRWSNYIAWHLLIETRGTCGDVKGALDACRELVRLAPTLQHHCLLAEHLLEQGHTEEARSLLERTLRDYAFQPGPIRRRNWRWASAARRLQKEVSRR